MEICFFNVWIGRQNGFRHLPHAWKECPDLFGALLKIRERRNVKRET